MNRLRLSGEDQIINMAFGSTDIIGTSANESVIFNIGVDNVSLNIGDNDVVYFGNDAEFYSVTNPGGNVVEVEDSNSKVTIYVGGQGTIGFNDGEATLQMDAGTPKITDVTITSTPVNMSSIIFSPPSQQIIDAGPTGPNFNRIIDGGYADSIFA